MVRKGIEKYVYDKQRACRHKAHHKKPGKIFAMRIFYPVHISFGFVSAQLQRLQRAIRRHAEQYAVQN
jgi:hypothetical protein